MIRRLLFVLLPLLLILSAASAQTHLTNEHVDLNIGFTVPSSFSLLVNDEDNGVNYAPQNAILDVLPPAQTTRPAGSVFDFVGVGAGQTYYRLPQSQNPNLLYLGVSGFGVSSSSIDSYDAALESAGRVSGTGPWVKLSLESVTGAGGTTAPGFFSAWQSGDTGPNVFMSSFSGGITSEDALWIVAGGHSHFNWGFSAPGAYEVTFRPSVQRSGTPVTSTDPFTILFNVTSAAIPEPGTLPQLLSLSTCGLLLLRSRKEKTSK
ncbi:MAG: choice-of-anchor M domain-containing protein [Armatimonas sp.]